jgi:hypothetical protein
VRDNVGSAFGVLRNVRDMSSIELLDALEEIAGASWWEHFWNGPLTSRRAALRDEIERRMGLPPAVARGEGDGK